MWRAIGARGPNSVPEQVSLSGSVARAAALASPPIFCGPRERDAAHRRGALKKKNYRGMLERSAC